MSAMTYNGYSARVEFDADDNIFVGLVAGIKEAGRFHGSTVDELKTSFEETIDHYLEICEKLDKEPVKPYSGNIMLRVDPEVHAAVAVAADIKGKSINQWATKILSDEALKAG